MERTRRRRTRKPTEPAWWWVEGLRKLSGVKVWVPLYCSKTEAGAHTTLRVVELHATRAIETLGDKHAEKEAALVGAYRSFRVVPDSEQGIRCSECTSNYLKRIKRGTDRLWKCLNCGHAWLRKSPEAFTTQVNDSGEAPTRLSKASKRVAKGADAPRRRSKRQKKPERVVPEIVPPGKRRPRL